MLCVGLDPDLAQLPAPLDGALDAIERFCCEIVDATADLVCALQAADRPLLGATRRGGPGSGVRPHQGAPPADPDPPRRQTRRHRLDRRVLRTRGVRSLRGRRGDVQPVPRYRCGDPVAHPRRRVRRLPDEQPGLRASCRISTSPVGRCTSGSPRWSPRAGHRSASAGSSSGRRTPSSSDPYARLAGELPILVPGVGEQGGDVAASVAAGTTSDGHRPAAQLVAGDPLRLVRRGLRRSGAGIERWRRSRRSTPDSV